MGKIRKTGSPVNPPTEKKSRRLADEQHPPFIFQRKPNGDIDVLMHERFRRADGTIDFDLARLERVLNSMFPDGTIVMHY
jgi:hypothetical protein